MNLWKQTVKRGQTHDPKCPSIYRIDKKGSFQGLHTLKVDLKWPNQQKIGTFSLLIRIGQKSATSSCPICSSGIWQLKLHLALLLCPDLIDCPLSCLVFLYVCILTSFVAFPFFFNLFLRNLTEPTLHLAPGLIDWALFLFFAFCIFVFLSFNRLWYHLLFFPICSSGIWQSQTPGLIDWALFLFFAFCIFSCHLTAL